MTIGYLFYVLEQSKGYLNLETYSLSQTTLEQVFMYFANKQTVTETVKIVPNVAMNIQETRLSYINP